MCSLLQTGGEALVGFAPHPIVLMSLRPVIPWRVGLHQWNTRLARLGKEVRNRVASREYVRWKTPCVRSKDRGLNGVFENPTTSVVPGPVLNAVMTDSFRMKRR